MTGRWLVDARMAESTRAMRKGVVDRNILPVLKNRLFTEISADDLRALYNKVTVRGAPATAVHVRDIVKQVYAFAILYGEKVENPVDGVGAASIAIVVPKDRSLSPMEIRLTCGQMESVATYPTIRLALRMVLLTLVRKNELIEATWAEIDFETAIWMIPKQRMKGRNPHVIYGRGAGRLQVRLSHGAVSDTCRTRIEQAAASLGVVHVRHGLEWSSRKTCGFAPSTYCTDLSTVSGFPILRLIFVDSWGIFPIYRMSGRCNYWRLCSTGLSSTRHSIRRAPCPHFSR